MFNKKYFLFFPLLLIAVMLFMSVSHPVLAQSCNGNDCPQTLLQLFNLLHVIVNTMLVISVIVYFIVIVVAGYLFMTAGGDTKKIDAAKKSLLFSSIGFALVFIPFFIIPLIAGITHITGGISIGPDNQLTFNANSTFTPTPLPSNLLNTATPTTYSLANAPIPCNNATSPAACVPNIIQFYVSDTNSNMKQYIVNSHYYYPIRGYSQNGVYVANGYGGFTCLETAIVDVMDGYGGYLQNDTDIVRIWQVLDFMKTHGYFGWNFGTFYNSHNLADSANYAQVLSGVGVGTWRETEINFSLNDLQSALDSGHPIIANLQNWCYIVTTDNGGQFCAAEKGSSHFLVIKQISSGIVYVSDPANTITKYNVSTFQYFMQNGGGFLEIVPSLYTK